MYVRKYKAIFPFSINSCEDTRVFCISNTVSADNMVRQAFSSYAKKEQLSVCSMSFMRSYRAQLLCGSVFIPFIAE